MDRAWDCTKCWVHRCGTEKCCIHSRPILTSAWRSSVFPFSWQALLHELGFCGQCFSQFKLWITGNIYNFSLTCMKEWLILSWKQCEKEDKIKGVSERENWSAANKTSKKKQLPQNKSTILPMKIHHIHKRKEERRSNIKYAVFCNPIH